MPRIDETPVTLPRWAIELLASSNGRLCNVCTNWSPPWDGHDRNPPCLGYAREVAQKALTAAAVAAADA